MATILPGRPETLTPEQETKLKSFWKLLFEICNGTAEGKCTQTKELKAILERQTGDELRLAYWEAVKYDNPDALILRFLRARKWDVEKAITMMLTTIHWRSQTMCLEEIVKKGFSISNMDYNSVKFMAMCFEAHFPECLGACLVHNAPWFFQGIWKVIKGWLDPVVASKVHFTKGASDLSKFIDKQYIPKSLGGNEDWTYQYVEPAPGENSAIENPTPQQVDEKLKLERARMMIIADYEAMTAKWIKEEGSHSKEERNKLRDELKVNYWMLDKYVRAKTHYDRIGMIGESGKIKL
ncbi:hypothetical protein AA313_de0204310 [Arthrobotrys entomopaga]|nr:hypothetical protein AA313_de0204310 [Arthrobotrys entomopaga]